MGSSSVAVGDLAFVGPVHASTLAEFRYVRVNRITGDAVCAAVVGPDSDEDEEEEISIPMETVARRVVDASEAKLWPGALGRAPPTWCLTRKSCWQQNTVWVACKKRRGALPSKVQSMLTVPFQPDDVVALVRPHDLQVVYVRRQHILDVAMGSPKKNRSDLYRDPKTPANPSTPSSDTSPTSDREFAEDVRLQTDIDSIRQQNRGLGKRQRESFAGDLDEFAMADEVSDDDDDYRRVRPQVAFRPSATQHRVHLSVINQRYKGKNAQVILEMMQHSDHVLFLGQPPVLRGAFDFGFNGVVSVMHFREAGLLDRVRAMESSASSTDFSERNVLRPVAAASSRGELVNALRSRHIFGSQFYNQLVVDLLDTATMFVDRYRGLRETDAFGWKLTTYWVTKKFRKFRSHLVARDTNAAAAVRFEFSRTDEELMEVKDIRSQHLHNEAAASRTRQGADTIKQADRPRRISSIPTPVLEALPVKDGKKKTLHEGHIEGRLRGQW
ncbi:Pectinesterase [Phytophthora nicotianae]|uniref:Pectinesterase n=1 Tax=Phytophthora nicotianae TaxID=4792 RepID=A0A0W8CC00_PHYNI|nr:Pectinesterase [Phytophthora nicotianae]